MGEEAAAGQGYKSYQLVGLFLGPLAFAALIFSPAPTGLSAAGWATAALGVWMAIWWITEAIPLFVTALLPLVFLPLLGIAKIDAAAEPFADPAIFLLLGGFLMGGSPSSAGTCIGASPTRSSRASAISRSISLPG
jgi:solute carrier family 13 (sodium-dependent dicarboxylate transporter), member 2/3/5